MTTTTSIATEASVMELTAQDRCDRCGAQAYVATRHSTMNLLWCAHHYLENEVALTGLVILDNRDQIVTT